MTRLTLLGLVLVTGGTRCSVRLFGQRGGRRQRRPGDGLDDLVIGPANAEPNGHYSSRADVELDLLAQAAVSLTSTRRTRRDPR